MHLESHVALNRFYERENQSFIGTPEAFNNTNAFVPIQVREMEISAREKWEQFVFFKKIYKIGDMA